MSDFSTCVLQSPAHAHSNCYHDPQLFPVLQTILMLYDETILASTILIRKEAYQEKSSARSLGMLLNGWPFDRVAWGCRVVLL